MTDVDFSACKFIKENLCYLTYQDFCHNAKIIKLIFGGLEKNAKIFYKWYVYANIYMNEYSKNLIWEYLNNDEPIYYIELIENLKKYRVK